MQYTAGSFAQLFVDCTQKLLLPRRHRIGGDALFPRSLSFYSEVPDLVLDRLLLDIKSFGAPETANPDVQGNRMTIVIAPNK